MAPDWLHAPYPRHFKVQGGGDQYGYDLLGARLWSDGDQGCVPQQDSVVQICQE